MLLPALLKEEQGAGPRARQLFLHDQGYAGAVQEPPSGRATMLPDLQQVSAT